ncbi:MAG: type I DNA topoisomerase [Rubricoccaceae bacterium]|nr:type I DNA topoisomerase [Rubricoccaceae bacterium]
MKLVIVESPAKAKTIQRYLGAGYRVRASLGHVRDLPPKEMGVDVEESFRPRYETLSKKKKTLTALRKEAAQADEVLLATDPDREGEIIAWHLREALKRKNRNVARVTFQEVTREAVRRAVAQPRAVDDRLVDAQQARRVMDRLVGYTVSPFLWRAARAGGTEAPAGLSAGRVQTAALRLVVEREKALADFVSEDYFSLDATFETPQGERFQATLREAFGQRVGGPSEKGVRQVLRTHDEAEGLAALARQADYAVRSVETKTVRKKPPPPFTTSTLQQAASVQLKMSPKGAMRVAQQLYEGVEVEDGERVGLITYMRTDATRLAAEAVSAIRALIARDLGTEYVPPKPHTHGSKAHAQEAHEAIRPTHFDKTPKAVRKWLTPEQFALYRLIYYRTVASQMAAAVVDRTVVDVADEEGRFVFRATGEVVRFRGFRQLYEAPDVDGKKARAGDRPAQPLPRSLRPGLPLTLAELAAKAHQTKPPPRYTEASLVKALEKHGVGRPSTYSQTLATIQSRGYAELKARKLWATDLGIRVCDLLVAHFPSLFDLGFTAEMEAQLDHIAAGGLGYRDALAPFYRDRLLAAVRAAEGGIGGRQPGSRRATGPPATPDALPRSAPQGPAAAASPSSEPTVCPRCGKRMALRSGPSGRFWGCTGFPDCRTTQPWVDPQAVRCPACGEGRLVERRSKKGAAFWGCTAFPACKHAQWAEPLPTPCPACSHAFLDRHTRRDGTQQTRCPRCEYVAA